MSTTAFAAEVIHSFDSSVRVAKDGELTVTEAVRVQAEGLEIRHGIYRDFPLTFKDTNGIVREVDFKLLAVERDGRAEPHSTKRQHGVIRIYAGGKVPVSSGSSGFGGGGGSGGGGGGGGGGGW